MTQQKAQIISPIDTFTTPGLNVTGVVTSTTFVGNSTGTATGLTGTPNIKAGIVTATTLFGDGSQLTGASTPAFVGQSTTSQSPTTTIDLSLGNVIYFTHNIDTTVAFASTGTVEKLKFIRTKDATPTARTITWPASVYWDGGVTPILKNYSTANNAQTFNLTTRDSGVTWYAYEEVSYEPQTEFFSWGHNEYGQLGLSDNTNRSSPVQILGTNWLTKDSGQYHTLATKTDGTLWVFGYNQAGRLGLNGDNISQGNKNSPTQLPGTTWNNVSAGGHSLATKTDGTLWAWGDNSSGRLGQNNGTQFSSPVQIPGTTWSSISGGNEHSLATKTDGTLWSWGYGADGRLGQNNRTNVSSPVQIPGTSWSSISAGQHSLATKTDNTLWSWGRNSTGQLGKNDRVYRSSPVQIPGTTWSAISAGSHSLATKTDGTLWSWGQNLYGELGQNNRTYYSSPVQIPGTTWSNVNAASSSYASMATKTDGTLWMWGRNHLGQLGQNNRIDRSSPVQVPGTTWNYVFGAGGYSVLAIKLNS